MTNSVQAECVVTVEKDPKTEPKKGFHPTQSEKIANQQAGARAYAITLARQYAEQNVRYRF